MPKSKPPKRCWETCTKNHRAEHLAWKSMWSRCENTNHERFYLWGGKGIRVCERWRSFDNFFNDMGAKPSKKHSLDRIDGSKGYCPSNCRWATAKQQSENTSNTRWISFRGETLSKSEWARRIGISVRAINYRLSQGWSIKDTLTVPKTTPGGRNLITYAGKTQSVRAWERELGLRKGTLQNRLTRMKMPLEKAMEGRLLNARGKNLSGAGHRDHGAISP